MGAFTGGGLKKAGPLLGPDPVFVANIDSVWIDRGDALTDLIRLWNPDTMDAALLLARREGSIGFEGDGPVRWAADVFGDDRSRAWVSAGLIWPLAEKLTANLAYAQQFERPRVRQWTLGFKFDF